MHIFLSLLVCFLFAASGVVNALENHVIMVRGVQVSPSDGWSFSDFFTWDYAVKEKESEYAKYFEFAFYDDISAIHFYEFTNDYDPVWAVNNLSKSDQIDYRESFLMFKASLDLDIEGEFESEVWPQRVALSGAVSNEIIRFVELIYSRFPESDYAFSYSGHGGPGGDILITDATSQGLISPKDSAKMLRTWTDIIGKKLIFIDFGGPCSKGGFSDLATFCPYVDYYIASDHPNGGYEQDSDDYERQQSFDTDNQWHNIFSESDSLIVALEKRIELTRKRYLDARLNLTAKNHKQANYLYSCPAFNKFAPAYIGAVKSLGLDLYQATAPSVLPQNELPPYLYDLKDSVIALDDPALVSSFEEIIVARADNRDFFNWEQGYNGIFAPSFYNAYGSENLDFSVQLPLTPSVLPRLAVGDLESQTAEILISGGVSSDDRKSYKNEFEVGDRINITALIQPNPEHVGEQIDVIVAIISAKQGVTLLLTPLGLITYGGEAKIPSYFSKLAAPRVLVEILDEFSLSRAEAGSYDLRVGYQVKGQSNVYYNSEPISFTVN
ncbi:hypothetical protein N9M23_01285 [Gammaproteobacteria bacterium]|jgi:hypothetical protein|nr:hypothetical protein [Gammaproteobacteria bacterium]